MTLQSLSSLTPSPGASSVAKTQESALARPERSGQTGLDFSAYLNQAMQSKEWAGSHSPQRQALADMGPKALERTDAEAQGLNSRPSASTESQTQRDAIGKQPVRDQDRSDNASSGGTHQELTQRALRNASLRAAQSRADATSGGRAGSSNVKTRKTPDRHDDEAHSPSATNNAAGLMPPVMRHPAPPTAGPDTQDAARTTATPVGTAGTLSPEMGDGVSTTPVTAAPDSSGNALEGLASASPGTAGLTTVQLGPHMQIITPGQGVVNEQSLQAFAQSMGIDANQLQQLITPAATGSVDASGLRAGVTATDALTGTPILPAAPTDASAIDLSQVVPAGLHLEDLHIDWVGGKRGTTDLGTPSTLDVLGMREGGIGADAITSLQESADAGAQEQHPDSNPGMGQSGLGPNARALGPASAQTAQAPAPQSMTEHFEKLSAKLATEMAGRIHEQFSQGEWKMKFALKPASLGQVDVQLEMRDGKLAAVLQADNPMTQDLLQNGSQRLRDALSQMGLSQSSVSVGDGRSQAFQGDRQSAGQGSGMASAHPADNPDNSASTVASTPRRDSLSQLDFYA